MSESKRTCRIGVPHTAVDGSSIASKRPRVDVWKGAVVTAIASLVERSAELKRELLEFSAAAVRPRPPRGAAGPLSESIRGRRVGTDTALDYFLLQHELRSGMTVVERFVASRPDLPDDERELLLGWRDVVEGIFEVRSRDGDALVIENLVDELTYRVHSNMGPSVFGPLESGGFMIGRLVPIGPEWLISGNFVCYPKRDRATIYRTAYEMSMRYPKGHSVIRTSSPAHDSCRSAEHDRFVQFFGADFVVIPGAQLTERMRSFYTFCREQSWPSSPPPVSNRRTRRSTARITRPIWWPRMRSRSPTTRSRAWACTPSSG